MEAVFTFTKPPLLQESRLIGGGSPNLVVLVERKVPVEGFLGAAQGFPLYENTDFRRAATRHFYCLAMEVGFGANGFGVKLL